MKLAPDLVVNLKCDLTMIFIMVILSILLSLENSFAYATKKLLTITQLSFHDHDLTGALLI